LPIHPIAPQHIDSIVLTILPVDNRHPFYFTIRADWEFVIRYNEIESKPMMARWNTYDVEPYVVGKKWDDKMPQIVHGNHCTFKIRIAETNTIPVVIDSIVYTRNDTLYNRHISSDAVFPMYMQQGDSLFINANLNTEGIYGETQCRFAVYFHYPNGESTKRKNAFSIEVIPDINLVLVGGSEKSFGSIKQGDKIMDTFELKNTGKMLANLTAGKSCVTFNRNEIYPDSTVKIVVHYDSRFDTGNVEMKYSIAARHNAFKNYATGVGLKLNGNVIPMFNTLPKEFIHFKYTSLAMGTMNRRKGARIFRMKSEAVIADSFVFENISAFTITSINANTSDKTRDGTLYVGDKTKSWKLLPGEKGIVYFVKDVSKVTEFMDEIIFTYTYEYDDCTKYNGMVKLYLRGNITGKPLK